MHAGFGSGERRIGLAERRLGGVKLLTADSVLAEQCIGAGKARSRQFGIGARPQRFRPGLRQRRFERPRIDDEQQIASADELAVLKRQSRHLAGDARPNLDALLGFESADIIVPIDNRLEQGRRNGDRRRALWPLGAGILGAARRQ